MAHVDGQWVAFPTHEELARATFDMVVAGRALPDGDVAIMMVEAEATEHTVALIAGGAAGPDRGGRRQRPGGRQAGHPRAVPGPGASWPRSPPSRSTEFPVFLDYHDDVYAAVAEAAPGRGRRGAADRRQGRPRGGP